MDWTPETARVELDAIHRRAEEALGWANGAASTISLSFLRELVRGRDTQLDKAITAFREDGGHLIAAPREQP